MRALQQAQEFSDSWFSGYRKIIEQSFIINHKVNAEVILNEIKTKKFDKKAYITIIKNLKEDEWSPKYLISTLQELDEITGISDEFLKKHAVAELEEYNLNEVKWEIMKKIVLDYAKFSKEFYDSLKYAQNPDMSKNKHLLMLKIMSALKKIHATAKDLVDKYSEKKYNKNSFRKFTDVRLVLEHLLLRLYQIILNIDQEEKLPQYRDILSREIIEFKIINS